MPVLHKLLAAYKCKKSPCFPPALKSMISLYTDTFRSHSSWPNPQESKHCNQSYYKLIKALEVILKHFAKERKLYATMARSTTHAFRELGGYSLVVKPTFLPNQEIIPLKSNGSNRLKMSVVYMFTVFRKIRVEMIQ